jgi:hypothetical protein
MGLFSFQRTFQMVRGGPREGAIVGREVDSQDDSMLMITCRDGPFALADVKVRRRHVDFGEGRDAHPQLQTAILRVRRWLPPRLPQVRATRDVSKRWVDQDHAHVPDRGVEERPMRRFAREQNQVARLQGVHFIARFYYLTNLLLPKRRTRPLQGCEYSILATKS